MTPRDASARLVAVGGDVDTAGVISYWRLSGPADADRLRVAWTDAGLDEGALPSLPSPSVCLRVAAAKQRGPRRLVRPIEDGWAIVDERADGAELTWEVGCRARLTAADGIAVDPLDHPAAMQLEADFRRAGSELASGAIGDWLVDLAVGCGAVSLRDTGGVYFVPRGSVDVWRRMIGAVRRATDHTIAEIPALRSDEAIESILDAVGREATAAAEAIERELAEEDLGARALRSRVTATEASERKLGSYEALLGRALPALRERLERLQSNLAAAALAAEADDEGRGQP